MNKTKKIVISVAGVLLAGICLSVPIQSFRGYDPALASTLYGLGIGLAGALAAWPWMTWPWMRRKEKKDTPGADPTPIAVRKDLVREAPRSELHSTPHTRADDSSRKINKRRLQLIVSGTLTVFAAAYALDVLLPTYGAFSADFSERRVWKAAGFDDPVVRSRSYQTCIAGLEAQWPSPSREELLQRDDLCSRPGWRLGDPVPSWWGIPIAFVESRPSMLIYVTVAVLGGPWLFGFLLVRVLPAGVAKLWRWLRTPDPTR